MKNLITRKVVALLALTVIVIQLTQDKTLNVLLVIFLAIDHFYDYKKYKSKAKTQVDKERDVLITELIVTFAKGCAVIICFLYLWDKAFAEGGYWIVLSVLAGLVALGIGNKLKENLERIVAESREIHEAEQVDGD